jgi:hypothetical protein
VNIGNVSALKTARRMLATDELADREELETNTLRVLLRKCASCCEMLRRQNCGSSHQCLRRGSGCYIMVCSSFPPLRA